MMPNSLLQLNPIGAVICVDIGWPISFNSYKDRKQHTTKKGRIWREDTIDMIWKQCGGRPEWLLPPCAIHFELWSPDDKRKRDLDNFVGKHVQDCIVKAHILEDDSLKHITSYHTYYRGKWESGKVIVTVVEL